MTAPVASPAISLTRNERIGLLVAAFLAWMFAGLQISLFVLIHRQMVAGLIGSRLPQQIETQWFAWYQAAFLFGAAAGGWLFGWLGDRVGRTCAMASSVLVYSLFTLVCYFLSSAEEMLAIRFFACLGIGGVWPNAVALVAEAWPNASRPLLAGLLGAAANVGFVVLGVICYCFPVTEDSWRWTFLVAALPGLLGVWFILLLPESPRWFTATQRTGAASGSPFREVLRPPLLSRTILGVTLGAIPVIGSAANANWLVPWTDHAAAERALESESDVTKPDARSKSKTQITRSGGAVFGSLLGGILASVVGRRVSYFLISLARSLRARTSSRSSIRYTHSSKSSRFSSVSSGSLTSAGCRCSCRNCFRRGCARPAPGSHSIPDALSRQS